MIATGRGLRPSDCAGIEISAAGGAVSPLVSIMIRPACSSDAERAILGAGGGGADTTTGAAKASGSGAVVIACGTGSTG